MDQSVPGVLSGKNMNIEYTSKNGEWHGMLYGESSMIIEHVSGSPYLHTGLRTPNTKEELNTTSAFS